MISIRRGLSHPKSLSRLLTLRGRYGHSRRASSSSVYSDLHASLIDRRLPLIYDYLSPQPSHLLGISLQDFFADSPLFSSSASLALPSIASQPGLALHPGYHTVYFPPQIPSSVLLPDGTDPLHSPGQPFVRRLWAGGRVVFNNSARPITQQLHLDGARVVCVEGIGDVTVKGKPGEEKIFVGIERRIGRVDEGEEEDRIRERLWPRGIPDDTALPSGVAIAERRTLVFLRDEKVASEAAGKSRTEATRQPLKVLRPSRPSTFTQTITPPPSLLFRFSALTFNAHAIHLDRTYTSAHEGGHRNLLVHGPLSLVLLLTLLRQRLAELSETSLSSGAWVIKEFEYRNLAPLYAEEEIRLCGREAGNVSGANNERTYELWAETPEGGYAVRGLARVEKRG